MTQVDQQHLQPLFDELSWGTITQITKLHGDASARRYYRVLQQEGPSIIVMAMPDGAESASDEVTNFQGTLTDPPFLLMAASMHAAQVPIPTVFHFDRSNQWILLEDAGTTILGDVIVASTSTARLQWYRRAIDLLVEMHEKMATGSSGDCLSTQRSFDATLLQWELDHFREYTLEARGIALTLDERSAFGSLTRRLTTEIVTLPTEFTHRDFQSRNIMVRDDALVVIDFQDALQGPYIYDLVSLLRDSYVQLTPAEVETLVQYYVSIRKCDFAETLRHVHLVTLQRKMKDSGRFIYIDRIRGNPNFLQYVAPSLGYVRHALQQLPEYAALEQLLSPHIPEWSA
jgi:N-acetylmuramate 1-kinase